MDKDINNEEDQKLLKSIDEQIEALFVDASEKEKADLEKSKWGQSDQEGSAGPGGFDYEKKGPQSSLMRDGSSADDPKAPTTADNGQKPKKGSKEGEGDRGRPKDVQDVPDKDEDGKRAKGYEHIQEKNTKTPAISDNGAMVKSDSKIKEEALVNKFEVSEEDYKFLQKAKEENLEAEKEEKLQKSRVEQADLIKSAVVEATQPIKDENEQLKKTLDETQELVKAIAKRPQRRKSVDNIGALEKSYANEDGPKQPAAFSKADMLDVGESLVKSNEITLEHFIELEDTGSVLDPAVRRKIEQRLKSNG